MELSFLKIMLDDEIDFYEINNLFTSISDTFCLCFITLKIYICVYITYAESKIRSFVLNM